MQSNIRDFSRFDGRPPKPLTHAEKALINECVIKLVEGSRTVFSVSYQSEHLGYVTTRLGEQRFKPKEGTSNEWTLVTTDWQLDDPLHGKAIVALVNYARTPEKLAA